MRFWLFRTAVVASVCFLAECSPAGRPQIVDARSASGLVYDLVGEGPLVVLIHGTNLDRRMWEGEVAWLRQHARVLRYDLRGQGSSDFPTEAYSNRDDLLQLLDELGESEVSLIGLSAGAQVALEVALAAPDKVRRLVLASPSLAGYVPESLPSFLTDLSVALRAGDYERANEVLLASSIMSVPAAFSDRVRTMVEDNGRLWTIPYSLVEQPSRPAVDRLEEVQSPTLVLVGGNDLEAIRGQGLLLKRRLPDARLITIADGGHLLNMTSPDDFREAVSAYLGFSED